MKEYFKLLGLRIVVTFWNLIEYLKVVFLYYIHPRFLLADTLMVFSYLFSNPYRMNNQFLSRIGTKERHVYGETYLTTFDIISQKAGITLKDTVFELGCGRGNVCLWLACVIGCQVVGIDFVPGYIQKADRIRRWVGIKNVRFECEDFLDADLSGATVVYSYGSCFGDEFLKKLINKLSSLPAGTIIITVSYPLNEYDPKKRFDVISTFTAPYPWGTADVYIQKRV